MARLTVIAAFAAKPLSGVLSMGSDDSEALDLEGHRVKLVFAEQAKSGRPLKAGDAGIVVSGLPQVGTLTVKLDSGEFVEVPRTHILPLD